jgi:hypothetical protein
MRSIAPSKAIITIAKIPIMIKAPLSHEYMGSIKVAIFYRFKVTQR